MPHDKVVSAVDELEALGLGPDTALMREPRLLLDERFLGALVVELEDELGSDGRAGALFRIGLFHGLRDSIALASRTFQGTHAGFRSCQPAAPPLAMYLHGREESERQGGLVLPGHWPESFESSTWLSRLGPADDPVCLLSSGYTSGWLSGSLEVDIVAVEVGCTACGDDRCRFVARDLESWRHVAPDSVSAWVERVPFDEFRELASRAESRSQARVPSDMALDSGPFDAAAPVVHIWGPVMVLPFTTGEEALQTMEVLSRDPDTAEVRAVVVDLRGEPLDEAFGAAALEQVLEMISVWGAEAILTGVSPLSDDAVESLESGHLLMRKDLPEAVAAAFQISQYQRRPV